MSRAALLSGVLVVGVACAASPSPAPPAPERRVTVSEEGGETHVSITDEPPLGPNPDCARYCERLVECWPEIPGSDPMQGSDAVRKGCLAENEECRTRTTETLCCGRVRDCNAFAQCQATSRDRVVVCERGP